MSDAQSLDWPLPPGTLPLGFSRVQAAAYVGVSPSLFDVMVGDHRMPRPKRINRRAVWDRRAVEAAFGLLDVVSGEAETNAPSGADDWDAVAP